MKNLYICIFIFLIIQTNQQIISNPKFLVEGENPFVLNTNNEYYYITTIGKNLKIDKESGDILNITDNIFSSSNYFFLTVEYSNNNYINNYICGFTQTNHAKNYYHVIYDPFISYEKIEISATAKQSEGSSTMAVVGSISKDNEFIIYGYSTLNFYLIFASKSQNYRSRVAKTGINDKLSCKFIEGENYICAMIINSKLEVRCLKYQINTADSSQDSLVFINSINPLSYNSISSFGLYDTNKNDIKLLCKQTEQNINCFFFEIKLKTNKLNPLNNDFSISTSSNDFTEKNCYLSSVNSEYLFCCAFKDYIKCFRINPDDHNIINSFIISNPGENSFLTIKNESNYAALFFMNDYNNTKSIYECYIYFRECQNKVYYINRIDSNEDRTEKIEIKLNELISIQTDKYYIEFGNENSLDTFGYFSINNSIIRGKTLISNDNIIYFNITKEGMTRGRDIIVNYIVSLEDDDSYSKRCKIEFKFKFVSCYKSCGLCSENYEESNEILHNCYKCKENYYPSPENNGNCYLEEEKKINWYFDLSNSKFGFCDEKCKSCFGEKNNCTLCANSDLVLDNGNCLNNCSEGYFPKEEQINQISYYKCTKCYENCQTCSEEGSSQQMNCITCKINQIKYNNSCFDIQESSKKRFYEPENNNNNISSCKQKFELYIKENSNECIPLPEENEGYYISNNETGVLSKCHENCLSCKNGPIETSSGYSMECLKCKDSNNEDKTMIKMDNNCLKIVDYNDTTIIFNVSGIYPDINLATCSDFGKIFNNESYECINRMNISIDELNDNYERTNMINITDNIESIVENKESNTISVTEIGEIYINNSWMEQIISIPSNKNECVVGEFGSEKNVDELIIKLKDLIKYNIASYAGSCLVLNGSNFLASIVSSNKNNPQEQIKKGISAFDLGNCTNEIKECYKIPNEENLIILNIETRNDDNQKNENGNSEDGSFILGKNTKLEIYDYSGRELNISICKDNIKIMKYIGDVDEIDMNIAKTLSDKGIDVFNAEDKFFNDICHPYDNLDKDIAIDDRRKDLYQNVTFCQNGCVYHGIDYELKTAKCTCNPYSLQIKENNNTEYITELNLVNFDSLTKIFIANLLQFNIDIVKCYNLILNPKNFIKNIGFFCLSSMFFIQIILQIIYLINKTRPLQRFLLLFKINQHYINTINKNIQNSKKNSKLNKFRRKSKFIQKIKTNPPPKINNSARKSFFKINSNNNLGNKFDFKNDIIMKKRENNNKRFSLQKPLESNINSKRNVFVSNNFSPTINIQMPNCNIYNENKKRNNLIIDSENRNSKNTSKGIGLFNEDDESIIKVQKIHQKGKKKFNSNYKKEILASNRNKFLMRPKNNKGNMIKLLKTESDIQDLDYEEAIIYDKRSFLKIYWGFLIDSQIILGTFCTGNNLDLFSIKLSFLVFTFQISFFLNSLFYTDEYISNAYHNDGVLDFFTGLPKSIYSFFATLITTNLLRMLSSSKSELMGVIRRNSRFQNYTNIINNKLSKLRKKLVVYFILLFVLESFFLYYVTSFCAVYRNSQKYWFIGCLESFGMDSFVSSITCIFLALFRYIGIKKHIKCFYILANVINTFL